MSDQVVEIVKHTKTQIFIKLIDEAVKDVLAKPLEEVGCIWKELKKGNGWVINNSEREQVEEIINNCLQEDEEGEEEDEGQSDSDDELIQKVLARRMKSHVSDQVIEETDIDLSDDEDVLSLCRRFRFVYKKLADLEARLSKVEC
jgi:hypothetical protein